MVLLIGGGETPIIFLFEVYIMAYVSQEDKKMLSPAIKAVLKKYDMKGTIAIQNNMTLVVNVKQGRLDVLGSWKRSALNCTSFDRSNEHDVMRMKHLMEETYVTVNPYWIESQYDDQEVTDFLLELKSAMEGPEFFCEDDMMTDYFHRSHYVDINIGNYGKPFVCTGIVDKLYV